MQIHLDKAQSPRMFDTIAGRYDFINTLISFGLHHIWRRRLIQKLKLTPNQTALDLATGTGDVAISLAKHPKVIKVMATDLSQGMLMKASDKISKLNLDEVIDLETQDAQSLNYGDETFDTITMSFGIRNVPTTINCLKEAHRVLKPGGRFVILESGCPTNPVAKLGHGFFTKYIVPAIGRLFSRNPKAYSYLNKTIHSFPSGPSFAYLLKQAGFATTGFESLTMGSVYIYWGDK